MCCKLFKTLHLFLPSTFLAVVAQTVDIMNCEGPGASKPLSYPFMIRPDWKNEKEKKLVFKYDWSYQLTDFNGNDVDISQYLDKMSPDTLQLEFRPFALAPSQVKTYTVTIRSKRKPKVRVGPISLLPNGVKTCKIYILPSFPVLIISGGLERRVPPNDDIVVSGESSFDPNFMDRRSNTLRFNWICHHTSKICAKKPFSTEPKFTFPGELVAPGDTIIFEMQVTLNHTKLYFNHKEVSIKKNQTIEVKKMTAVIELNCIRNCVPLFQYPYYTEPTVFGVSCIEHCKGLQSEDYEWTVRYLNKNLTLDYDYSKGSYKRKGTIFEIPGSTLKTKTPYVVSVSLKGSTGIEGYTSEKVFFLKEAPDVKDCKLIPDRGNTLKTKFQFTCTQNPPGEGFNYQVFAINKNDPDEMECIIYGHFPEVMSQIFNLPASKSWNYVARSQAFDTPAIEVPMIANVVAFVANKTTEEAIEVIDELYNNTEKISSNDPVVKQEGLGTLRTLADELKEMEIKDERMIEFIEEIKMKIGIDVLNTPIRTLGDVTSLTDSVAKIQELGLRSHPLLQKITTSVCKKMGEHALHILQKVESPVNLLEDGKKVTASLARCIESSSHPYPEINQPITVNITTPVPSLKVPVLEEHYENYEDFDEKHYENLDNLKEATFNVINVSTTAAKMTALTAVVGEDNLKKNKQSESLTAKNIGNELFKTVFSLDGVTILPSEDFKDDDHSYDILVVSYKQDIMWWNPQKVKVATNIIVCQFWHSTCKDRVLGFDHPVNFFIGVKTNLLINEVFSGYSISVTPNYATMNPSDLNYEIRAHRIFLPPHQNLHIYIRNLTDGDALDVVFATNEFPTIEHFKKSVTVTKDNVPSLTFLNEYEYPIFVFFGVLVNKTLHSQVTYKINTIVRFCIKWLHLNSSWVHTCRPGKSGNESAIHCECQEVNTIAGYIQSIPSPPQQVTRANIQLELQSCYIIFITLATTLAIFYLLILWTLKQEDPVYFLADNERQDLFAYVIVVNTGFCFRSGTTSNITIRLTGDKKISEPHVLNYPDPKLRLLQQFGNNRFVLSSSNHLGEIKEIELWSDLVGPSPSWYCRDVTVYDMQLRKEWYFNVQKSLSIKKSNPYVVVKQTVIRQEEQPEETISNKRILFFQILHFPKLAFYNFVCARIFPHASFLKIKPPKSRMSCRKLRSCLGSMSFSLAYHTWSIWQNERNFPRSKKLGVMLSTVLTTFLAVMIVLGLPRLELRDGIDENNLNDLSKNKLVLVAFLTSFVTFLVHFLLAWCFRLRYTLGLHKRSFLIPPACNLACCATILIFITISTSLLMFYGFWEPHTTSMAWLFTSLSALAFGVFVHESLFLLIQSNLFVFRQFENFREKFNAIYRSVEIQRNFLYQVFGKYLLRPYFTHLHRPLSRKQIKRKMQHLSHRFQVIADFEDLVMFSIYLVVLFVVIWVDKDSGIIHGKTEMVEMVEGVHTRTRQFSDSATMDDLYLYLNETLIPTTQPTHWYAKYVIPHPAIMVDVVDKFLGVVRLRQHRLVHKLCTVPDSMAFLNISCNPEFSLRYAETKSFGYNWGNFSRYIKFDRMESIWKFTSQMETKTFPAFGEFATYSGGGYIAYLGRTLYNSLMNFRKILTHLWVNAKTRVVFIEFLSYNVDYNVFSSVVLRFEQSASGYVHNNIQVYTARLLFAKNELQHISLVFFGLFLVWVGMLFFKQSVGIIRNFRHFYKDRWMVVDTFIILISFAVIASTIAREYIVGIYLNQLEEKKHNEFLSYAHLFYVADLLTFVGALLVCVSTIRLWKFLRFAFLFRVLEHTVSLAIEKICMTVASYCIILTATAISLVYLIGDEFERISTVKKAASLLLRMTLRAADMKLADYLPYGGIVFKLIVYSVSLKMAVCLIISNIVSAYFDAQLEFSSELEVYNIKHFIQEKIAYYPKWLKYKYGRLYGGQSEKYKVSPKSDKFLYSTSMSIATKKIHVMKFMVQRLIKNLKKKKRELSKSDVLLMLAICDLHLEREKFDEVDVFFKGCKKGGSVKLVPENDIEKIANFINLMLNEFTGAAAMEESPSKTKITNEEKRCFREAEKTGKCLKKCNLRLKLLLFKIRRAEALARRVLV